MPTDILEIVANIIYHTPRPRPVDPAILFDLIKIHRLVDEATNLAVRAASDMAAPTLTSLTGDTSADYYPLTSGAFGGSHHGTKLSRERKFRIREQACQKLARAYRLNEILCSVATMQGATALEQVGEMVLQRNAKDPDAQYVHFFHEKIPSRQVALFTSLGPLDDILLNHPGEAAVLRTRSTVKIFKNDLGGAIQDLTHALSICRMHEPSHALSKQVMTPSGTEHYRKRHADRALLERDQGGGLEGQLLFQRASIYLTEACNYVRDCFPVTGQSASAVAGDGDEDEDQDDDPNRATQDDKTKAANKIQAESRKMVKTLARRALKDYMTLLSHYDYSPDLPVTFVRDFNERISSAIRTTRAGRSYESVKPMGIGDMYTVYPMSDLFAAVAPPDLPPYPSQELVSNGGVPPDPDPSATTCEWATFHPLLADALHSLLLCHCLVQTSVKELQRHANMVARLIRLSDGYPVFQGSRSPARSDWNEILSRTKDWLELSSDWDTLCTPAPLLGTTIDASGQTVLSPSLAASAAANLLSGTNGSADATREDTDVQALRSKARELAIVEALEDDRVTDLHSFRMAVRSRQRRDQATIAALPQPAEKVTGGAVASPPADIPPPPSSPPPPDSPPPPLPKGPPPSRDDQQERQPPPQVRKRATDTHQYLEGWHQRWASDDSKDFPTMTERAAAVAVWIRDAPLVTGTARRKKRGKKNGAAVGAKAGDVFGDMETASPELGERLED